MKIGNLAVAYPMVLSPMASLTDIVFRRLMDEIGFIGYMVTEMVSAEGIRRKNERTLEMVAAGEFRTPQFVQLFGSRPESFTEAAAYINGETGFDGIDINLGCPVRKITKRGAGSALLKNLSLTAEILSATRKASPLPLTAKIRLPEDPRDIPETIRVIEGEGVDAVAVHFRRASDRYSDPAIWDTAPVFRKQIRSLFIGNGDIKTPADAREKLGITDGIMIGREALRNPLIFALIHREMTGSVSRGTGPESDLSETLARLLGLIETHYEPKFRLRRLKAYTRFLVSGRSHSKRLREKIYHSASFEEARQYLDLLTNGGAPGT